ncbi:family 16 glycoside hydrolase [Planctomicrobium sp. SH661]|uniref:family 16 glycoside hydrolase n=1 Tax=Planctomicrobium sp. SH661 TaxID=3448124 RepID=UPI003F5B8276
MMHKLVSQFPFSRRACLQTAAGLAMGLLLVPATLSAADEPAENPYGDFKIGLQSYSLRNFDEETALQMTKKLGLHYWEAFPNHIPISTVPGYVTEQKTKLKNAGVELTSFGVVGFDGNESKAREIFDFAKAIGLQSISADPNPDAKTFDMLDKLVEEYQIPIAIHNHGPGHRYEKVEDVLKVCENRHPLIGACVDTGHYLRSDEDPVEVVRKLGKRVFGVHLKDVRTVRDEEGKSTKKLFTILGEGDLNVVGLLRELRNQGYELPMSIEYEENPQNPLSDLELCLATVRNAVAQLDDKEEDFISLWDGKTLENWKINESPDSWAIENGEIIAKGPRSHLFYVGDQAPFKNFQLRVDVKAAPNSNGGIYYHTKFQEEGWPGYGFETQVNNTYVKDPRKTGSLYAVADQHQQLIPDDTWWTQEVTVNGKHVVIKVDGKVAAEYTEPDDFQPDANFPNRRFGSGTFALQAHDPHSVVHFKNIRVKKLPD